MSILPKQALHLAAVLLLGTACTAVGSAQNALAGYWKEPGGSVIHIEPCGAAVCASIVTVSPQAPVRVDAHNPDPSLRGRSLCGLRIGDGFQPVRTGEATGGRLYDPKSGKTYQGSMRTEGDSLFLRGYIGLRIFGRTETWQRTMPTPVCAR